MDHSLLVIVLSLIFVLGYAVIALEHHFKINKSGTAIIIGALLWFLVSVFHWGDKTVSEALMHDTQEIFSIVVFLLAAMTIVEVLVHYRLFDWLQEKIMRRAISQKQLFWLLGLITFVCSAFLDNLTTTLIMIQIGRKIYRDKANFLVFTVATIIAANAGGAASPIGDVTTIMLWLAEKFTALQIISIGILPALAAWVVPHFMLSYKIKKHEEIEKAHPGYDITPGEPARPYWTIIGIGLFSFVIPVLFNIIGLPPFLGLLMGIGMLWVFIDMKAKKEDNEDYANGQIIKIIQRTDIATLKFFIGILLAVGALAHAGILQWLNGFIFGSSPDIKTFIIGNIGLGFFSSILDNVPLVAAAIKMFPAVTPTTIWVLLAITAGTGGSMLAIGSAAGVAAMGQVKELSFGYYLKRATVPALLGFIAAVLSWCLVYYI